MSNKITQEKSTKNLENIKNDKENLRILKNQKLNSKFKTENNNNNNIHNHNTTKRISSTKNENTCKYFTESSKSSVIYQIPKLTSSKK